MNTECIVRQVRGNKEYVLAADVIRRCGTLIPGESVYLGRFSSYSQSCGPYGSDHRTICCPLEISAIVPATIDGKVPLQ